MKIILALILLAATPAIAEPDKCVRKDDDKFLQVALETVDYQQRVSMAMIDFLKRENARLKSELETAQARLTGIEPK